MTASHSIPPPPRPLSDQAKKIFFSKTPYTVLLVFGLIFFVFPILALATDSSWISELWLTYGSCERTSGECTRVSILGHNVTRRHKYQESYTIKTNFTYQINGQSYQGSSLKEYLNAPKKCPKTIVEVQYLISHPEISKITDQNYGWGNSQSAIAGLLTPTIFFAITLWFLWRRRRRKMTFIYGLPVLAQITIGSKGKYKLIRWSYSVEGKSYHGKLRTFYFFYLDESIKRYNTVLYLPKNPAISILYID